MSYQAVVNLWWEGYIRYQAKGKLNWQLPLFNCFWVVLSMFECAVSYYHTLLLSINTKIKNFILLFWRSHREGDKGFNYKQI